MKKILKKKKDKKAKKGKKKSKKPKAAKKPKKRIGSNPDHLTIAILLIKLGSKQSAHKLIKKLRKKCKDLKILQRTQTGVKRLREKFHFVRKALKKKKLDTQMRSSLVNGFFTQFFNRLLKCPIVSGSKVASTKIKNALKKLKSKKAKVSNGIKILRKIVKLLDAHPDPKKEFFGSLRRYYNYLKSQKRIKKLLKKKINKSKLQKKIVHLKTKLAKVNTIKKEMKQHIKMCLRTKGKFAKQFCKKVKELGRKFRKIAKKNI